ncbi:MAG: LysR family transcriptional regulator [Rhodobacter sp.]|nr:LysR family transcriptional regulator [Rhodobacter sp.]
MERTMDWARLPYFLAVARTGSLRAAAETVGGTHATVDRNLKALEATYGVRLFDRSKSGLSLTSAGAALVPMAEAAEDAVIAGRRRLQGLDREASGTVRLSVPTPFGSLILPEILARFARAYPEIELDIAVTNRIEDITRSETDVSVRVAFHVDDDVVGRKVLDYAVGLYASPAYLDRSFAQAGPKGEGLQWVGWGSSTSEAEWVRDSPFPKAALRYKVRSPSMIVHMTRAGLGMSYLPHWVAHDVPDLVPVPGTDFKLDRAIWLLLHSDLQRTTRVRLLVDHLAAELRKLRPVFLGPLA